MNPRIIATKNVPFNARKDLAKSKLFFIELYPDDKEVPFDETLDALCMAAVEYAYIIHDKDVNREGAPLKPHCHFYIKTAQEMSIKTFCEKFHVWDYLVEYALDKVGCIKYLRHLSIRGDKDDGHHVYDAEEVFSNIDCNCYWESFQHLEALYINELINVAMNWVAEYGSKCPLSVLLRYAQEQEGDKRYDLIGTLARRSYFFKTALDSLYAVRYEMMPFDIERIYR